jgi:hypothetical protein
MSDGSGGGEQLEVDEQAQEGGGDLDAEAASLGEAWRGAA